MPDTYFSLKPEDQADLLTEAAAATGREAHLLEKDIWVVWALEILFTSDLANQIVFKGGTSLSKAHKAIDRFSEDIDLTYDIRRLLPDIVTDPAAIPPSNAQADKWTKAARERLPKWLQGNVVPLFSSAMKAVGNDAAFELSGELKDTLVVGYKALKEGTGYAKPNIRLEFGARSTGEPYEAMQVDCDIASHFPEVVFPKITASVMKMERTFWEKATAIHVFCKQAQLRGERLSRHWYDVSVLLGTERIRTSLEDKSWLRQVVQHKSMFFRMKDKDGSAISYEECLHGHLNLIPKGEALQALRADYDSMTEDGILFARAPAFDAVLEECAKIEAVINRLYSATETSEEDSSSPQP